MQKTKSFSLLTGVFSLCLMVVFALGFAACGGESQERDGKDMLNAIEVFKMNLNEGPYQDSNSLHVNEYYGYVDNTAKLMQVSTKSGDVTYYCCGDYTRKVDKNVDNGIDYDKYSYGGLCLIFDGKKYDTAQLLAAVNIFYFDEKSVVKEARVVSAGIHEDGYIVLNDIAYENADKIYIAVEWFYLNDDNTDMHSIVVI